MQSIALASLTATYTDSEGEDGAADNEDFDDNNSNTPRVNAQNNNSQQLFSQSSKGNSTRSGTNMASSSPHMSISPADNYPNNSLSNSSALVTDNNSVQNVTKVQSLVNYFDDTVISDDDGSGAMAYYPRNGKAATALTAKRVVLNAVHQVSARQDLLSDNEDDSDEYGVKLPPKPSENCPVELQEKFANYYRKMESGRLDMNKII